MVGFVSLTGLATMLLMRLLTLVGGGLVMLSLMRVVTCLGFAGAGILLFLRGSRERDVLRPTGTEDLASGDAASASV